MVNILFSISPMLCGVLYNALNIVLHVCKVYMYMYMQLMQIYMYVYMSISFHQEKQGLLQQLQALEREDRTLRQKALATMPVSALNVHACVHVHVHVER